jgi:hypothetical protein
MPIFFCLIDHISSISAVLALHNLRKVNGIVTPAKARRMGKGPVEGENDGLVEIGLVVEVDPKSSSRSHLIFVTFLITHTHSELLYPLYRH